MLNVQFYGIWFSVDYDLEAGCEDTQDTPGVGERVYINSVCSGDVDFKDFMYKANLIDELEEIILSKIS
jgi:hypothetical protein